MKSARLQLTIPPPYAHGGCSAACPLFRRWASRSLKDEKGFVLLQLGFGCVLGFDVNVRPGPLCPLRRKKGKRK